MQLLSHFDGVGAVDMTSLGRIGSFRARLPRGIPMHSLPMPVCDPTQTQDPHAKPIPDDHPPICISTLERLFEEHELQRRFFPEDLKKFPCDSRSARIRWIRLS